MARIKVIYMFWKKSRHSAFRTEFLLDIGTELFKTNENWTAPGKFGTNGIPNQVALGQVFLRVLQFFLSGSCHQCSAFIYLPHNVNNTNNL
jgi:hypothetical protein